ncbi:protein-L-isoaspartate O-methyltransferase family protein [Donghicola mangrovi]|uniref:Protein-L-isoaspartate O-methyltransferase n=1 Tax=Donghicola mangrovi TaxID=2729614 RepID=A0A850Q481_9RHOB|nr:protein-L-isoaspartate O-methyltransferase [Donghicola mangrovi]NVO23906.1 protein-L-isoaspartate O-methyltransferase [Donghicola mangrovi]
MTDFAKRRTMMVDTQVRPSDVTKFNVIEAMLAVPREVYVPEALIEAAYMGENIELAGGRVILEARTTGKLLDALDIQPDEMVLDLGCAYGYSAAVVAHLAEAVIAVETSEFAKEAEATLSQNGVDNVAVIEGELAEGAAKHGPYDVIIVEGGVEELPAAIEAQLKEGGRIGVIFQSGALGTVKVGYKLDGLINWRYSFNAGAPVLKGFAKQPSFAL